jgi:hypothetical protein
METEIRRFGDPSARLFRVGFGSALFAVLVLVAGVIVSGYALANWVARGDAAHILGALIGSGLALVLVVVVLVAWCRYWGPVARTLRRLAQTGKQTMFLAARIPHGADEALERGWPEHRVDSTFPGTTALVGSNAGIQMWSPSVSTGPFLRLEWAEINEVVIAEFVDGGSAHLGLAIVAPGGKEAITLQVVRVSLPVVIFPGRKELEELARRLEGFRANAT